ncbi:hypothetical protein GCM10011430_28570 [Oxalicibacterium solurbis]|uniref:Uncharacterized protein n=1 Tax=Oxalicibacterium solurbis TaxID=69280 RepID=A0A8J3FAF2_9BURK|nr:hypothetical protein GCM10011430_28570 [Oxalicibacterium solurbis]
MPNSFIAIQTLKLQVSALEALKTVDRSDYIKLQKSAGTAPKRPKTTKEPKQKPPLRAVPGFDSVPR